MKHLRAVVTAFWALAMEAMHVVTSLIRRDGVQAARHARMLAGLGHERVLKCLLVVQHRLPFWSVKKERIERVLVVKLDRIGDMVNTTPVFDALRELFPAARIDLLAHPGPLGLLDGDGRIAERLAYCSCLYHPLSIRPPGLRAMWLLLRLLWRRYPVVVYLRGSFPFLTLGLTSRLAAALYTDGEPVLTRYLKPIEALFGPVTRSIPRLPVVPAVRDQVERLFLPREESRTTRVAIQATSVSETREWPGERFAELADRLHRDFGAEVHFFGSQEDRNKLNEIARAANLTHSFHLGLRMPEVVAAISACDLFIGNDSGLSHIAGAVGLPLVVVWGAANLNMSRPNVPSSRLTILYRELPCRCTCPELFCVNPVPVQCLKEISVAEVIGAVARLLQRGEGRVALPLAPAAAG